MNVDRRRFAQFLTGGVAGSLVTASRGATASPPSGSAPLARAQARLPPTKVTRIRIFYPPNGRRPERRRPRGLG
jgi:hypothetical protein